MLLLNTPRVTIGQEIRFNTDGVNLKWTDNLSLKCGSDAMLRILRYLGSSLLCFVIVQGSSRADSLQLRDGRHLHGRYLGGTSTAVGFMTDRSIEYFPTSSVLALIFDTADLGYRPTGFAPGSVQPISLRKRRPFAHRTSPSRHSASRRLLVVPTTTR